MRGDERKQRSRRVGSFVLFLLMAAIALAVGAWLGGWRPPAAWRSPALQKSAEPHPGEIISDSERRSLDDILRERGSTKDH